MQSTTRKQLPWVLIVSGGTLLIISLVFYGLFVLQRGSKDAFETQTDPDNVAELVGRQESQSQVLILQKGVTNTSQAFQQNITLTEHALQGEFGLATTITVSPLDTTANQTSEETLTFTRLNEVVTLNEVQYSIRTALDNSAQLVISKVVPEEAAPIAQ